jgi:hypothetical protein
MQVKESYKKKLQHLTFFLKKTLSKETKQKKPTQKNEKMKENLQGLFGVWCSKL